MDELEADESCPKTLPEQHSLTNINIYNYANECKAGIFANRLPGFEFIRRTIGSQIRNSRVPVREASHKIISIIALLTHRRKCAYLIYGNGENEVESMEHMHENGALS